MKPMKPMQARRDDPAFDAFGLLALRLRGDIVVEGRGRSVLVAATDDDAVGLEAALELAWTLADHFGHSVLLVDAAFGDAALGTQLGLLGRPGLADWLDPAEGSAAPALQELVQPTQHPRIQVLPQGGAGRLPVVHDQAVQRLMQQAASGYDFVVVRASVLRPAQRVLEFGALADAALLFAVEEVSTTPQVARAQRLLHDCGARRVGLVLTQRPRAGR